jgi:hypothetical protein
VAPSYPDNVNVVKLVNDNGFEFWLYPMDETTLQQEKPSTNISPPGQGPKNAVQMQLQGMTLQPELGIVLWDNGSDHANGTHSSQVVSIGEQVEYLLQYFHDSDTGVGATMSQEDAVFGESRLPTYDVTIEQIRIPLFKGNSYSWIKGAMRLTVGGTV